MQGPQDRLLSVRTLATGIAEPVLWPLSSGQRGTNVARDWPSLSRSAWYCKVVKDSSCPLC